MDRSALGDLGPAGGCQRGNSTTDGHYGEATFNIFGDTKTGGGSGGDYLPFSEALRISYWWGMEADLTFICSGSDASGKALLGREVKTLFVFVQTWGGLFLALFHIRS